MSNTFKLPPELVRIITENLSSNRAELHALTLVCKSFYWEAMRLLYRSMTDSDGTKHFKFLVTLRNRPQIADLVHTYHLPTTPNSKKRALWPVILRCMLLMINLKELAYTHLFAFPFTPFPQAKRGQKMPFQLETFIWDVDVPIYDVEHFYPAKLFQFLRTQPEIKFLLWKNTLRPGMTLAPNVLPKLKVLRVSWGQMATFLSGRSISDFFWRDQNKWGEYNYFNSDIVIETAIGVFKLKEFATLRAVSLPRVIWLDMPRSRAILQAREGMVHPNKIKVLELCSVYNTGEILSITAFFPCLQRIIITPRNFGLEDNIEFFSQADILALYERCHKLVYVDLQMSGSHFKRWINKALSPDIVTVESKQILELE